MEEKKLEEDLTPTVVEKHTDYVEYINQCWDDLLKRGILHLNRFDQVAKFKSIRRAIKKGKVTIFGDPIPKRPFKNIKAKKGSLLYQKKRLYEQFKHRNGKLC